MRERPTQGEIDAALARVAALAEHMPVRWGYDFTTESITLCGLDRSGREYFWAIGCAADLPSDATIIAALGHIWRAIKEGNAGAPQAPAPKPFREFARERNGLPWPCITRMERYDDSISRMMETVADYMDTLRLKP